MEWNVNVGEFTLLILNDERKPYNEPKSKKRKNKKTLDLKCI